jgi:hypothetical protein
MASDDPRRLAGGQHVDANEEQIFAYRELRASLVKQVLPAAGEMWNWPLVSMLTRPSLARIMHLIDTYELILDVPGVICEFGVHLGASTVTLANLRDTFEPHNKSRHLHAFDTFEGFAGVSSEHDRGVGNGDFAVPVGYGKHISEIVRLQRQASGLPGDARVHVWAGDAVERFEDFLVDNPHALIALAFFDMDIFEPTRRLLERIGERMTAGSIVVFDQLNCAAYPGETLAALEALDLARVKLTRSRFLPYSAWMRWGDA